MMNVIKTQYSLAKEAFKSLLMGCTLSILIGVILLLAYSLFNFRIIKNLFYFVQNAEAWGPWLAEIERNWRIVPFVAFMFYLVGALQFLLTVLPFAIFISKGLKADLSRSWFFYVASGALIGGGPWILIYLIFGNHTFKAIEENASFVYPGLSTGLFAGAILKRRLIKLATASGIENSIK